MYEEDFLNAIRHMDMQKLKAFIFFKPSFAGQKISSNELGWTPLHLGVSLNSHLVVDELLKHMEYIDVTDGSGWAASHLAILQENLTMLKKLYLAGANLDLLTPLGESQVFLAVNFNFPKILAYLLPKVNNIDTITNYEMNALSIACIKGHQLCLKLLLPYCKSLNAIELTALALKHDQIHIVDFLHSKFGVQNGLTISNSNNPKIELYYLIHQMKINGSLPTIELKKLKELIDNAIIINDLPFQFFLLKSLLTIEGLYDSTQYISYLINALFKMYGCETVLQEFFLIYPENATHLIKMLSNNQLNFIKIDATIVPPSYLTIINDDIEAWRHFSFKKEDLLKWQNESYNSVLYFVARFGAVNILEDLIEIYHLDVTTKGKNNQSILHVAGKYGHHELINVAVKKYFLDVNIVDENGDTPLHITLNHRMLACSHLLLQLNANSSIVNKQGKSPVMLAQEINELSLFHEMDVNPLILTSTRINTIVFQGGGVKGLAFYGALKKLIEEEILRLEDLKIVAGASAGAINAMLLALGYSIEEVGGILAELNFKELLDIELRDEFFAIKNELSQPNGLELFLGKGLFHLLTNFVSGVKSGDFKAIKNVIIKTIIGGANEKYPMFTPFYELLKALGVHDNEFEKIKVDIERVITRIAPFLVKLKNELGIFPGEVLRENFVKWVKGKGFDENLTFARLHEYANGNAKYKDLYIVAYNASRKRTMLFSYKTTPDAIIVDAVRCSMSIQVFFTPHKYYVFNNGKKLHDEYGNDQFFDGGSLDNYILGMFDKRCYINAEGATFGSPDDKITNYAAIGLRLLSPEVYAFYEENESILPRVDQNNLTTFLNNVLFSIISFTKQESDYYLNPDEIIRTVHINTKDVDTLDFDMSLDKRKNLEHSGVECASKFVQKFKGNLFGNLRQFENIERLLPRESDERFDFLFKLACQNIKDFCIILNELQIRLIFIRDKQGNTLFHRAVEIGNVKLLENLYETSPCLYLTNSLGMTALDCITKCKDTKMRESILSFFENKKQWYSTILYKHNALDKTTWDKKDILLKVAHTHYKSSLDILLHNLEEQKRTLLFLKPMIKGNVSSNWLKEHKNDNLFNYVYTLIKNNEIKLFKDSGLSIDQQNEQGFSVLHCFIAENDEVSISNCFKCLIFPNLCNKNGEFPLDMIMKIQAPSAEKLVLAQQMMILRLIKQRAHRCAMSTRLFILDIMSNFHNIDRDADYKTILFSNMDTELQEEYISFKKARHVLEINHEQGLLNNYSMTQHVWVLINDSRTFNNTDKSSECSSLYLRSKIKL